MIPVYQVPPHALRKATEVLARIIAQRGLAFFTRDRVFVLTIETVSCGVDWSLFSQEPERLVGRGEQCERMLSEYHSALGTPGVPVLCWYKGTKKCYRWAVSVAPGLVQAGGSA